MLQRQVPPLYYGTTKRIALPPRVHADPLELPPSPVPGQPPGPPLLAQGVPQPPPALPPAGVLHPPPAPRPALLPAGGAPRAGVHRPPLPLSSRCCPSCGCALPPPGAAPPAGVSHSPPGLSPAGAATCVRAGTATNKIPAPTVLSCLSPGIINSRARKNPAITTEPVPSEPMFTFGSLQPKTLSETGSYTTLGLSTAGIGTNFKPSGPSNLPNFCFGSLSSERLVDLEKEIIDDDAGPSTSAATNGKKRQGGRRSRTKGRSRSPSPLPIRSAFTTAARPSYAGPSYAGAAWRVSPWGNTPEVKKHNDDLRSYMDECCAELAEKLWETSSYHIQIDYDDLKTKNKQLAYFIANNLKRFQSSVNLIGKSFLLDMFRQKQDDGRYGDAERFARVTFTGIPNSIFSLEDFIARNKTEREWLFQGHPDCSHDISKIKPALRRVTQKVVAYVTSGHQNGNTWDGKWSLADWEVTNDSTVELCKEAVQLAGREMSKRDLAKISTEVIPKLADTDGKLPAFFEHLRKELLTPGTDKMPDSKFYDWFYEYLRFHPALMSSKARSKLLLGFYFIAVRLHLNTFECYDSIFSDLSFADWVQFVHGDWWRIPEIQWRVFWFNNYPPAATASEDWVLPYNSSAGALLNNIRQMLEHSNRHTFWMNVQTMVSSFEPELLAADVYPNFLPEFIKLLFKHNAMEGESEFLEEWKFYLKSTSYQGN